MLLLVAGVVLFFAPHSVPIVAPYWRERMLLYAGEARWKSLYFLLSATGLALMVLGFSAAQTTPVIVYVPAAWLRYATFVLMLPVFPLLLATYLPGRILATIKHPMLTAVQLWAAAHLASGGTLPQVVLFSAFLLWALIDRLSLQRREASAIRRAPPTRYNDVLAVACGLALYVLFLWRLHAWIFGVPLLSGVQ